MTSEWIHSWNLGGLYNFLMLLLDCMIASWILRIPVSQLRNYLTLCMIPRDEAQKDQCPHPSNSVVKGGGPGMFLPRVKVSQRMENWTSFWQRLKYVGIVLKTQVSWKAHPLPSSRDTARMYTAGQVVRVEWHLLSYHAFCPLVVVVDRINSNILDFQIALYQSIVSK